VDRTHSTVGYICFLLFFLEGEIEF
jgi:hypothetical protein